MGDYIKKEIVKTVNKMGYLQRYHENGQLILIPFSFSSQHSVPKKKVLGVPRFNLKVTKEKHHLGR